MSDNIIEKSWRNNCRRKIGWKGQFMKRRPITKKKVVDVERLCSNLDEKSLDCILSGREIFEPLLMAKEMWCIFCDTPLSFAYTVDKIQIGLASIYKIKCYKCLVVKGVHTNTLLNESSCQYTINSKAATDMLAAGIGESQFNLLLCTLNISPPSQKLLKRCERHMGQIIETVAMESCSVSLESEIQLTREQNDIVEDE